ncbi:hypothetical protein PTTW11_06144 [Pyrenophora teres f. teres]|uniref:Uncharacterized protein n=1 Tax=Pyrenophora teres f. teres TaxID=97479 RepID=A0A6S6W9U4_9PLEO|nr:hypothetical protein PTTW11_06144 [Pyrenophora teres f. teres]
MSSSPDNTNTSPATSANSPPRYSTTAPPTYNTSDAHSLASKHSTSKSFFLEMLPKKTPKATAQGSSTMQQKVDAKEAKQAARACYFSAR